jgi:CBS domain containing-hemolysin-like protein
MVTAVLLFLALVLVLLNAFFVLAEFAIVKVRSTRVEELARGGSRSARWVQSVIGRLDAHLSATQLGITLASLGLGWVGEPALAHLIVPTLEGAGKMAPVLAHTVAATTAFMAITFLHVVFGELAPKSLAIRQPYRSAMTVALPLRLFYYLFFPLIWVFNGSANLVLRLARLDRASVQEVAHSEEELRIILASSLKGGGLENVSPDLLTNLLDFSRLTARQIMVPRPDVVYLSLDRPSDEILRSVRESGHTRFPVCHGTLDQVVGTVHIKDLIDRGWQVEDLDLPTIMREAIFVPETMRADRLLRTFQRRRLHMAIVVDEYGGASGIVTLEDVLEEIVGEVQDEFDEEAPHLERMAPGIFRIEGSARLEDVLERLGVAVEDRPDVDTIGGYVQATLGRLARSGDRVSLGAYELRVVDARGTRVRRVEARRKPAALTAGGDKASSPGG